MLEREVAQVHEFIGGELVERCAKNMLRLDEIVRTTVGLAKPDE